MEDIQSKEYKEERRKKRNDKFASHLFNLSQLTYTALVVRQYSYILSKHETYVVYRINVSLRRFNCNWFFILGLLNFKEIVV